MTDSIATCPAGTYTRRQPESLVIGAYRAWLTAAASAQDAARDEIWNRHELALGPANADIAISALSSLVERIGICATCPLRCYPRGSTHLCRDECLLLSMIAGAQHGDEQVLHKSAELLTCNQSCVEVVAAAAMYATALRMGGATLLPVPAAAIEEIAKNRTPVSRDLSTTIH